jgi:DNA-binding transcriptional MerR regulator
MSKTAEAFRTISEVADDLDVPKHVLRFWEAKFPQVRPMKRGGGRRYYRPEDMELLRGIRHLLHAEGYTIKGVQKILREHGVDHVKAYGRTSAPAAAAATPAEAKRRGRSEQPAVPAVAVVARNAASGKGRGANTRATPAMSLQAALKSAIVELETCRRLLRQNEQQPAAKPATTKGRPVRARSAGS